MKAITITLRLNLDEEIDEAIYGAFYSHTRNENGEPFVQPTKDSKWIPVNDWKRHRYIATETTLRRVAKHFIEIGKRMQQDKKEDAR